MKAKLLKSMTVDGKLLPSGTVLDVSGWRNAKSLEGMRYLTFLTTEEIETPKKETKAKVLKTEDVK